MNLSTSRTKSDYSHLLENVVDGDKVIVLDAIPDIIWGYMFQPYVAPHVASLAIKVDNNTISEESWSSFEDSNELYIGKQ